MIKYKFHMSGTNYIEFTKKEMNNLKNVYFDDGTTGKLIYIQRNDGKTYMLIVPLDMLEISKVENE